MIRDEVRAWPGYKSFRQLLAPGTRESTWLRTASPYIGWRLWRQPRPKRWQPESTADIRKRERAWVRSAKPAGYTWRVEKLTPEQRIALGCLPKPAVQAMPRGVRVAA